MTCDRTPWKRRMQHVNKSSSVPNPAHASFTSTAIAEGARAKRVWGRGEWEAERRSIGPSSNGQREQVVRSDIGTRELLAKRRDNHADAAELTFVRLELHSDHVKSSLSHSFLAQSTQLLLHRLHKCISVLGGILAVHESNQFGKLKKEIQTIGSEGGREQLTCLHSPNVLGVKL
jgi:hypothetical protein